jgi:hypothetical protein
MRDEEPTPAFREHILRDNQAGFLSANEPSTPDSTPREGNVPVRGGFPFYLLELHPKISFPLTAGPVEQNPWAE